MPIPFVPPSFMIGAIVIWPHSIASIPLNWHLCDGTHGTPNMDELFCLGTTNPAFVGNTGGSDTHLHTFTGDGHFHSLTSAPFVGGPNGYHFSTDTKTAVGTTDNTTRRPPFRKLPYIMRIS